MGPNACKDKFDPRTWTLSHLVTYERDLLFAYRAPF